MTHFAAQGKIAGSPGVAYYLSRFVDKARLAWERSEDLSIQWLWALRGIPAEKIGFGSGPLSWMRSQQYSRKKKEFHICLLELGASGLAFGPLTAWAINRSSKRCSATVNQDLSQADIIWVYCQDPLPEDLRAELNHCIRTYARPAAAIINPPATYNAYHSGQAFRRLEQAGVRVPRHNFTKDDIGAVQVVYKADGCQGAPKSLAWYDGERPGMSPFEFVDSRGSDGLFRRYRVYYLAGMLHPSEVFVSPYWNVCLRHATDIEYTFDISDDERRQITQISRTLGLDYFAVDFLRRHSDRAAVFTDINVYPTIQSPRRRVRSRGDYGMWHTFDARKRMSLAEPSGGDVWEKLDSALADFVHLHRSGQRKQCNVGHRTERLELPET